MKIYRNCAGIIIFNTDKKVLVCARNDASDFNWQFPQGGIENNEKPSQAALRELKEETNIDASKATVISARVHPKTNKFMAYIHLTDLSDDELKISDHDLDDVKWVKINEINNYFKYPIFDKVSNYLDTLNKK